MKDIENSNNKEIAAEITNRRKIGQGAKFAKWLITINLQNQIC